MERVYPKLSLFHKFGAGSKQEEVYLKQYHTFEEASSNIGQFIDEVYNAKRLHSSLGYVPPVEFEMAYYQGLGY